MPDVSSSISTLISFLGAYFPTAIFLSFFFAHEHWANSFVAPGKKVCVAYFSTSNAHLCPLRALICGHYPCVIVADMQWSEGPHSAGVQLISSKSWRLNVNTVYWSRFGWVLVMVGGLLHFLEKKSTIYRCTKQQSAAWVRHRRQFSPFHKSRVPLTGTRRNYSNMYLKFDSAGELTAYSQPFHISSACTEADPDKDARCSHGALWCGPS